jgi:hypothetical protein
LSQISAKLFNRIFWQLFVLFDELEKIAASTIFKNDPEVVSGFIPVKESKDMPVFKVVKNTDFI